MPRIDKYFEVLKKNNGSDLHVSAGLPPKIRIHGLLEPLKQPAMTNEDAEELLFEILDERQRSRFRESMDLDFAYEVEGLARFRCNFFRQVNGIGAVFRIIPAEIQRLQSLGVPHIIERFAHLRSGLVLVTGPTGSGKSTTLAALVDYINTNFRKHIITIEEPIEFVHERKKATITQREVGKDTDSFTAALRACFREDPDVILVGEMRDLETISLAVTLAEMGQLVFATLHTNSAPKTIDRIIDVFPEGQQAQIRTMLSVSLKGVCSQLLLRRKDGKGRVPVNEILFATSALPNIIREGAVHKIVQLIEGGRGDGMQLMDDSIMQCLKQDVVSPEEAFMKAIDKNRFQSFLPKDVA
ncbi:MAG: type IV pilus twitching motility protein PilT [Planctomycetes bacterium]|nr:type IV pilus twitching motility protein PilT [Planctomycetota bacterium]